MKKVLLTVSALSLLMAVSCKKNDSSSSASGKAAILTSGKWQMTASTSQSFNNGVGGTVYDEYAGMDSCEKDDYYIFNSSNAIIIDAGATKCVTTEPQQYTTGQWSLTANDTKMIQSNPVLTIYWNIDQLDNNVLTMSNYDTSGSTVNKSTQSYKHIN
ncbi:hypothetical protein ACTHGU_05870 [Chitinophagaceae bacterium MMS25-I14]